MATPACADPRRVIAAARPRRLAAFDRELRQVGSAAGASKHRPSARCWSPASAPRAGRETRSAGAGGWPFRQEIDGSLPSGRRRIARSDRFRPEVRQQRPHPPPYAPSHPWWRRNPRQSRAWCAGSGSVGCSARISIAPSDGSARQSSQIPPRFTATEGKQAQDRHSDPRAAGGGPPASRRPRVVNGSSPASGRFDADLANLHHQ